MKKILFSIIFIAFTCSQGHTQNIGISTGNWCSTESIYNNPASIAERGEKISIGIVSLYATVENNLGHLNSNGGLIGAINRGNTNNLFSYDNSNTFSLLAPAAEVHGPSVIVAITPQHSLALTTRIRGFNQFNNFDRSLYQTIQDPNYVTTGNVDLTSKNFNYTAHLWSEVGLSYGGVILDAGVHKVKVGVTLRYLGGIGYVSLKGNNLDAHYRSGNDSVSVTNSDVEFASNLVSTKDALLNGFSNNSILSEFFGAKSGKGIGGDIGVIYDFTPYNFHSWSSSPNSNYMLRVSASVTDLGSINYPASNNSNANVTGNGYITGSGIAANVRSFDDFKHYAVQQGFTADTSHRDTRLYMPAALRFSADYDVYRHFYVNAMYVANIVNRQDFSNSYYNQLTITPRYDSRLLSIGLPLSYGSLSQTFKVGLGMRFSGFFVGSDDMLALFSDHQYGFNFYVGGFVPLGHNKQSVSDRDGDGIPDKLDKCPDEPGTKENHGCPETEPDMEHGGSPDTSDNGDDMAPETPTHRKSGTAPVKEENITDGNANQDKGNGQLYYKKETMQ